MVLSLAGSSFGASHASPRQDRLQAAEQRLNQLQGQFEIVVERYDQVRTRLGSLRQQIADMRSAVEAARRSMESNRKKAVKVAVRLYKGGGSYGELGVLLSSRSIGDLEARLNYLN